MNALVKKEIRLLLPAWVTAMLLVTAPLLLGRLIDDNEATGITNVLTTFGVAIGGVVLGLAGIGRELAARTFSLLLAQPRPRGDFWRAKLSVLLVSLIPLALILGLVSRQFVPSPDRGDFGLVWLLTASVAVTGGLWTTLLFRQIIAAFWISVLLPLAILVSVLWLFLGDEIAGEKTRETIAIVLLVAYSVAGYLFARWQFRHAQDTAWTGGNVSLPSADRWWPWKRTETVRPKMHPLRALLGKEFQFQQVSFLLAGLLLLVQVAVLLAQKFVNLNETSVLVMIVQHFWGIWIVMPLLVGCSAVAEERKLGTLEPQLCLPVSRAWQFAVKVFVTLVCGTVLGALVPVLVEVINPGRGSNPMEFAAGWTLACVCLAFVAFYASSLTHQLLQALGAAIGMIVVGLFLTNWFIGSFSRGRDAFSLFGATLWQGPLVLFVGAGVMLLFAMGHTWRRLRWFWAGLLALIAVALLRGDDPGGARGRTCSRIVWRIQNHHAHRRGGSLVPGGADAGAGCQELQTRPDLALALVAQLGDVAGLLRPDRHHHHVGLQPRLGTRDAVRATRRGAALERSGATGHYRIRSLIARLSCCCRTDDCVPTKHTS